VESIQRTRIQELLEHLNEFRRKGKGTAKSEIGKLFIEFIPKICKAFGKSLFVIVDGLDESPQAKQLSFDMCDLAKYSALLPDVSVLVSSRPETVVERVLSNKLRIHITEALVSNDLETHLNSRIEKDENLKAMDNSTKKKVKKGLLKKHQGV
jgi:hypothetical protein